MDVLIGFAGALLEDAGVPEADARVTAERLVEADARGRTGHGLIRLAPYLDRIAAGGINVRPDVRVLADRPSTAQVDGDNGLGQVVVTRATDLAIAKAGATGVGIVGTVHSNHAGAAGLYALRAAEAGLVGIYLAVANANGMPPWGGRNPLLGTNPLAVAVPAESGAFVLDIATTAVSHGTIKTTRNAGLPMPEGWVVDRDGRPITDPARADEGFLVPMGGYKGSGLTIAIGLLAGVLNGAAFGSEVVDHRRDRVTPTNTGQLLVVIAADLFRPLADALGGVEAALEELRCSDGPGAERLRLPGDRSAEVWAEAQHDGVEISDAVWAQLHAEADRRRIRAPYPLT
ncbi:MAG: hypothetical protein JWM84_2330 [Nocardioides sp.]|nr:hypothetical protein [Nocardioides sp.]